MEKCKRRRALFFSIMLILISIPFNAFAESENIRDKVEKILKKEKRNFEILNKLKKDKYIFNSDHKEINLLEEDKLNKNKKYKIYILYGFSDKKVAAKGEKVNISAHQIQEKEFSSWISSEDVVIEDPESKTTSFVMVDRNIKVVACFTDIDSGTIGDEEDIEDDDGDDNQNSDINEIDREKNMKDLKKKRKELEDDEEV